jgi:hypothetical protein
MLADRRLGKRCRLGALSNRLAVRRFGHRVELDSVLNQSGVCRLTAADGGRRAGLPPRSGLIRAVRLRLIRRQPDRLELCLALGRLVSIAPGGGGERPNSGLLAVQRLRLRPIFHGR